MSFKVSYHSIALPAKAWCNAFNDKAGLVPADAEGEGCFARVYAHPNPALVVKVGILADQGHRGYSNPARDDGYVTWLEAVSRYPSQFHPRIVSALVHIDSERRGVCIVVMERLSPASESDSFDCAQLIDKRLSVIPDLENNARKIIRSSNPHSANLGKALSETWQKHSKDLHSKNWMVRKTPTGNIPVITDPAV